jgi:hypothetical protein
VRIRTCGDIETGSGGKKRNFQMVWGNSGRQANPHAILRAILARMMHVFWSIERRRLRVLTMSGPDNSLMPEEGQFGPLKDASKPGDTFNEI